MSNLGEVEDAINQVKETGNKNLIILPVDLIAFNIISVALVILSKDSKGCSNDKLTELCPAKLYISLGL